MYIYIYIYMYVIQNIAMKNTLKFSHQVLNMQSYCKRSSKFQPNYEMWSLSSSWNQLTNERFKLFLSCSVHMKWWCTIQLAAAVTEIACWSLLLHYRYAARGLNAGFTRIWNCLAGHDLWSQTYPLQVMMHIAC